MTLQACLCGFYAVLANTSPSDGSSLVTFQVYLCGFCAVLANTSPSDGISLVTLQACLCGFYAVCGLLGSKHQLIVLAKLVIFKCLVHFFAYVLWVVLCMGRTNWMLTGDRSVNEPSICKDRPASEPSVCKDFVDVS